MNQDKQTAGKESENPSWFTPWRLWWRVILSLSLIAPQLWGASRDRATMVIDIIADGTASMSSGDGQINDTISITAHAEVTKELDASQNWQVVSETTTWQIQGHGSVSPALPGLINSWTYTKVEESFSASFAVDLDAGTVEVTAAVPSYAPEPFQAGSVADPFLKLAWDQFEQNANARTLHFTPHSQTFSVNGQDTETFQPGGGGSGHFQATYRVTFNAKEVEAVIKPPPFKTSSIPGNLPYTYDNWRPRAGKDESDPGTNFVVLVGLRQKGDIDLGYITKAKWFLELVDVSREPGVCVNWPSKESAKTTPDLQFMETDDIQITDGEGIKAESKKNTDLMLVVMQSYDWGAYAKLHIRAELEDGRKLEAYVEDAPGKTMLVIPKDEDDNRIADSWQDEHEVPRGIEPKFEYASSPEDTRFARGDGISLYEAYRGFDFDGVHERLNPTKKHIFIHDPIGACRQIMKGGRPWDFVGATFFCEIRYVDRKRWTGAGSSGAKRRIVNFNSSDLVHAGDQHALDYQLVLSPTPGWPECYTNYWKTRDRSKLASTDIATSFGMTFPDYGGSGDGWHSPSSWQLICVYPPNIEKYLKRVVQYQSWALPQFAAYWTSTPEQQAAMSAQNLVEAQNYIRTNAPKYQTRLQFTTKAVAVHELGHGIGIDDLRKPRNVGPVYCPMRYVSLGDYPSDADDRLELARREWTRSFCFDATGTVEGRACYHQIVISDVREAAGIAAINEADQPALTTGGTRVASTHTHSPAQAPEVDSPPDFTLTEAGSALTLEASLEWTPVLEGDPLSLRISLPSPANFQAGVLAGTNAAPQPPAVVSNWIDGLTVNLYQVQGTNRLLVLGGPAWTNYVLPDTADTLARLGIVAHTREFLIPSKALNLATGQYVLSSAWNGTPYTGSTNLPSGGVITGQDLVFDVSAVVSDEQKVLHWGRLAWYEFSHSNFVACLSYANEALPLIKPPLSLETVNIYFMSFHSLMQTHDYLGAVQVLRDLKQAQASWGGSEAADVADYYLDDVSPLIRFASQPVAGQANTLLVYAIPTQRYVTQSSPNMSDWLSISTNVPIASPFTVVDSTSSGPEARYYRVVWGNQ